MADCSVSPETDRAFSHAESILTRVEAKDKEVGLACDTAIEIGAAITTRIAQSATKTVFVSKVSRWATQNAATVEEIGLI